jgi:hypothetical protein
LQNELAKVKNLLGLNESDSLPANWDKQLFKRSEALNNYTLLTKKGTKRDEFRGREYTDVIYHEKFLTKKGERSTISVFDDADAELKK